MKKITIIVAIAMAMVMGFYASSMPTYMLSGGVIISRNRLQNVYAEEIVDEEQTQTETVLETEYFDYTTNNAATLIEEATSKRTLTEKHYRMSDGSYVLQSYGAPIHYLKSDPLTGGSFYEDIDNTLQLLSGTSLGMQYYANAGNNFSVNFPTASNGVYNAQSINPYHMGITYGDNYFRLRLLGNNSNSVNTVNATVTNPSDISLMSLTSSLTANEIPQVNIPSSNINYAGIIDGGISLGYEVNANSVDETITISQALSSYVFTFELEVNSGITLALSSNNEIVATDAEGIIRFIMSSPYIEDANGEVGEATYSLLTAGSMVQIIIDGGDWAGSSERSFPMEITPVIKVVPDNSNIQCVWVDNGSPTQVNGASIGVGHKWGVEKSGYYIFDLTSGHNLGYTITKAMFSYHEDGAIFFGRNVTYDVFITENIENLNNFSNSDIAHIAMVYQGSLRGQIGREHEEVLFDISCDNYFQNYLTFGFYPTSNVNDYVRIDRENVCLTLQYTQNLGLENNYVQESFEGNGFSNYVNVFTGHLTTVLDYMEVNNGVLPLSVSGIHSYNYDNVKYSILNKFFELSGDNANTYNAYYGYDVKLNLEQYCVPYTIDQTEHYIYIDADGTLHTLYKHPEEENRYDGNGYKFIKGSTAGTGSLFVNGIECLYFENGHLKKIIDQSGYEIHITYNNNSGIKSIHKVSFVKNTNGSVAELQYITFGYSVEGFLEELTSNYGEKTSLTYEWSKLKKVQRFFVDTITTTPSVNISYDTAGRLASIKDVNGYGYSVEYSATDISNIAYVSKVNTIYNTYIISDVKFVNENNNMRSVIYNNNIICNDVDGIKNAITRYKFAWDGSVLATSSGYDYIDLPQNISMTRKEIIESSSNTVSYSATEDFLSIVNGCFTSTSGWTLDGNAVVENNALILESSGAKATIGVGKSLENSCITLFAQGADSTLVVRVEYITNDNKRQPLSYTVSVEECGSYILIPIDLDNGKQNSNNPSVTITIENSSNDSVVVDNVFIQEMNVSYSSIGSIDASNNSFVAVMETVDAITEQTINENGNVTQIVCNEKTANGKNTKTVYNYSDSVNGIGNVVSIVQYELENDVYVRKSQTTYTYSTSTGMLEKEVYTVYDSDSTYTTITEYEYDNWGNVTRVIETDGDTVNKQYYTYSEVNKNLRLTKVLNCKESVLVEYTGTHSTSDYYTLYEYNDFGQLVKTTDSLGVSNEIIYDATGMLKGYNTAQGQYLYTYDTIGRVSSLKNGETTVVSYTYTDSGMLLSKTYANGTGTETYTYDAYGNITHIYVDDDVYVIEYTENRIVEITNLEALVYNFTYNSDNRMHQYTISGFVHTYIAEYSYNDVGKVTEIKDTITPFGGTAINLTYNYSYNGEGNVSALTIGNANFTYGYDVNNRLTSRLLKNGSIVYSNMTYSYADYLNNGSYNMTWRVSSVTDSANSANNRYYTYDAYGNITGIYKDAAKTITDVVYYYDSSSRLTSESFGNGNYSNYVYNSSNDIISNMNLSSIGTTSIQENRTFTYSEGKLVQLTTVTTFTSGSGGEITPIGRAIGDSGPVTTNVYFAYDALGNPVKYKVSSLEAANNLVWTGRKLTSGTLNNKTFSYVYDVNGIRSSKTVNGLKTNYYIYNAMILAEERLDASGNVDTFIYYLYDESGIAGMIVYDGNVGSQNGVYYYFTKNLLGDIIGIKNTANELVASYTYNAWGECTIGTNVDGIATLNPFRYRGYYYDTETGFYYLQTRYYDPTICRFVSADDPEILGDVASVVGQLNLYAYCLNNPVMGVDPSGAFVISSAIIAVCLAGFIIGATIGAISGYNQGLTGWDMARQVLLGGIIGTAAMALLVAGATAIATVPAIIAGSTKLAVFGTVAVAKQFAAVGLLVYDAVAIVVAPLFGIVDMVVVEYGESADPQLPIPQPIYPLR